MKKLKLLGLASLLVSGIATAAPSCNGFQLRITNNLADDLVVSNIKINNSATIQPDNIGYLPSKKEQVFIVGQNVDAPMDGTFTLRTATVPYKEVNIKYNLSDLASKCKHFDYSVADKLTFEAKADEREVKYSINN